MCLGSLADGFLLYFMSKIKILFGNIVETAFSYILKKILIFFNVFRSFLCAGHKKKFKNKKNIILIHF
jgi:hypothetical protein